MKKFLSLLTRLFRKPRKHRANPAFNALVIEASRAGLILTRPTNRTYWLRGDHVNGQGYNQKFQNTGLVRDAVNARAAALKAEGLAADARHIKESHHQHDRNSY